MLSADDRYFVLRRLHSLSGVIPLGAFLFFHFFENASARNGPAAFNETVYKISRLPYLYLLEVLVLALPLLFHGIFGLYITAGAKLNVASYPYARNWAYFLQRLSGVLAFAYIAYHVATTRLWSLFLKGQAFTYADLQADLTSPYVLAFYILGIVAVTYHFSNGLWSFSITWGLVRAAEAQKRLALLTNLIFVVLCLMGLDILSAFIYERSLSIQAGDLISKGAAWLIMR